MVVDHLQADAAGVAADHGFAFPHGLGHGQAETFPERFLQYEVRGALQRVDGAVRVGRQQQDVNVRVALGGGAHLGQHRLAFGIVAGAAAGEHQLQRGNERRRHAIGLDHADGVLETVEARYLQHHRPRRINAVTCTHAEYLLALEIHVFLAQGINAGRHQVHRMRQDLREVREREDAGIVAAHEVTQVFPHRAVGVAGVYVTAPDPFALARGQVLQQRRRLGVVDENHVGVAQQRAELFRRVAVGFVVRPQQVVADDGGIALQGVVKLLGALVEIVFAIDDFPACIHPQLALERDQPAQDFGHATALARGIHVHHLHALERRRQLQQLADDVLTGNVGIGVQHVRHRPATPK